LRLIAPNDLQTSSMRTFAQAKPIPGVKQARLAVRAHLTPGIQAKLKVSSPADRPRIQRGIVRNREGSADEAPDVARRVLHFDRVRDFLACLHSTDAPSVISALDSSTHTLHSSAGIRFG
jgi:hypothetical protein